VQEHHDRAGPELPPTRIRCLLDDVALLLTSLPPQEWPRWINYLLRALNWLATERDEERLYEAALTALLNDIQTRQTSGRW
jgi:hypothetical protein